MSPIKQIASPVSKNPTIKDLNGFDAVRSPSAVTDAILLKPAEQEDNELTDNESDRNPDSKRAGTNL